MEIFGDVEHAANLAARAFRQVEEMGEILGRFALEAFGDVVHDRDSCSLKLISKAEVGETGTLAFYTTIQARNLQPRLLPNAQVFKAFSNAHLLFTFAPSHIPTFRPIIDDICECAAGSKPWR